MEASRGQMIGLGHFATIAASADCFSAPSWKSSAKIAFLFLRRLGFLNHLSKILTSGGRPCSPDDVVVPGLVPFFTNLFFPGGEKRVPLPLGANPQRFEIPTIFAIVSERQLSPK